MNKYDKELFHFLTEEENLKGLILSKNQFPMIRAELIRKFWVAVVAKVEEGLSYTEQWKVVLQPNMEHQHNKLFIEEANTKFRCKDGLPSFIFCFQRLSQHYPFMGFWLNERTTEFDITSVKEYIGIIQKENFPDFKGYDDWFLIWTDVVDFNLSIDETLLEIAPNKMESKAEDFAQRLLDLFEKCQDYYEIIKNDPKFKMS